MRLRTHGLILFSLLIAGELRAQCSGQIMEPGFQFLSSSRGCAPFTVQIETLYLSATPGTKYFVNWGDGTPEQIYTQTNPTGVIISHTYPNSPIDCGYDIIIDAENSCNPRSSVVPVETQVVVWTNDIISVDPGVYRVCQGFATDVLFADNSDWNCYPRPTRENNEARWIQWIYGTGPAGNRIPGMRVNNLNPGSFPYLDPAPGKNPIYPVLAPGEISLSMNVPATLPADIGKEFEITLKNWNQCNPYDNLLMDGNAFNPVNNDLVNGDNPPQVITARIVIVDVPAPDFLTRLGNSTGPIQSVFCVGDAIFFDNETPSIAGAAFAYKWQFYDNNTGAGSPLAIRTNSNPTFTYNSTGQKLIRLAVRDTNAAGNCETVFERVITISPSLVAQISVTDFSGNAITSDFCQELAAPFSIFEARFNDTSIGTVTATTLWRWEFYDPSNTLIFESPSGGGYSNIQQGPLDRTFTTAGIYRAILRIRDNLTSCETSDEVQVRVFRKPQPDFSATRVCAGNQTAFDDLSTINPVAGEQIILREWDMRYDGVTFAKDPALDNQTSFNYSFPSSGTYRVALRITTDQGSCFAMIDKEVMVDPLPNSSFIPDITSGCSTLHVSFTNNSVTGQPDGIEEFVWEVDAGAGFVTDSVQRPTDPDFSNVFARDFINNGTTNIDYYVRLRVRTVNGCERVSAPVTITVYPAPRSGFSSLNYSPFNDNCTPVSVSFSVDTDTQEMNPSEYLWTISDANGVIDQASTGTTPEFMYEFENNDQSLKDFYITLRASLPSGCFGDSTRVIRVSPVPSSAFVIDTVSNTCEKIILNLNATQKGLQEYEWTIISNGTTIFNSTTVGDVFDYEMIRSATVDQDVEIKLETENFANCRSVVTSHLVNVKKADNINTSFTALPVTQQYPAATVSINNTTNSGPWEYNWDFGDGTTSTNPTVNSHTYADPGKYTISLSVSSDICVEIKTADIEIRPAIPVLEFDFDPAAGCAPLIVNFTNLSRYADATTYYWEFGINQGTSHAINPTYTYYEPGIYSVTLSASNSAGESAQITKQLIIEVYETPSARFSVKPRQIQFPGGKLFTDNQSFGATSYLWDFGDGYTSEDFEPEHQYNAEGVFDIILVATNSTGCSDTSRLEAGVQTVRSGQMLIPNAFSPNLSGPGNSGGQNDTFKPILRGVVEFQMLVFNRWGELLFETTNADIGWDGYYQGRLCQQDVYVYKIIARYSDGQTINRVGDIHLMR